ncbi:YbfB/YjiJ family MFS transporter [Herminiimonas fonticola]|uniref:Putative MFS family arabinose efflux permease n=1 Tax=Herminiimonas fonticola TaxID=303380 RepID=A0A4R6G359_9BURK|nr:YbfB/YjiJ family MFS transporter [Herminiimonas fonticola]RBA23618.1 hypothetical protein Hfont_2429 [Herminiimonas fonticola]TDN88024.1 putative MFS family arabinose efflux permease [Herminiimonas fonticola]
MPTHPATSRQTPWRYIFAGFCASLIGIGLARFAYTPLIPQLIQAHWFSASNVVYLGAANLAGYLVGALLGRHIAERLSNEHTLRLMMLSVTIAFLACAFPLSTAWFFAWRFISGVAGGSIMVLVAATVLPHVFGARKGLASGAIFLGIGIGIAGSGTVVPLLLNLGLRETWIGLALLSALITAASWFAWPASKQKIPVSKKSDQTPQAAGHSPTDFIIKVLYAEYALMAIGLVPAMVFLVDFITRGLGAGTHLGSLIWILYGVGAIFGPPLYGFFADRLGGRTALRFLLLLQVLAVVGLASTSNYAAIAVATIIVGTFPPGIVPLVLTRIRELIPHHVHQQNIAWGHATTMFALFQALAGYAYSAIFNGSGGNHRLLFLVAALSLGVALIADIVIAYAVGGKSKRS